MAQFIVVIIVGLGSLAGVLFIAKENSKVATGRHIDLTNELLLVQPTATPSAINGRMVSPTPTIKVKIHYNFSPTPTSTIFPWSTPLPTTTPQPNPTPVPTSTPQPTTTPIPTNIPTPTPTIFIGSCTTEGWEKNCRESCCYPDGRCGYWESAERINCVVK
ncbi:MAG: hypothetical protein HY602_03250 [Parcubacteria group bacterium]|nr:hypothetical protein [Parcubacteria group bacterium]